MGFPAAGAVMVGLMIQSTAVTFGAVGTPILVGVRGGLGGEAFAAELSAAGLDTRAFLELVTTRAVLIHAVIGTLMPTAMVVMMTRFFGERRSWTEGLSILPFALFGGLAFTVPYALTGILLGPEFPSLLGALAGLALVTFAARRGFLIPDDTWDFPRRASWPDEWVGAMTVGDEGWDTRSADATGAHATGAQPPAGLSSDHAVPHADPSGPAGLADSTAGHEQTGHAVAAPAPPRVSTAMAWAPYLVVAGLLVLSRLSALPLGEWLTSGLVVSATDILGTGLDATSTPLYLPGTILLVAAGLTYVLHRMRWPQFRAALGDSARMLLGAGFVLAFTVPMVRVYINSGINTAGLASMPIAMAEWVASGVGGAWPFFAPMVGALGAFIAGSNTVSNLMFSEFQWGVAQQTALSGAFIIALQAVGAAAGNMIAIHNVVAASATVGLLDREGATLRKTVLPTAFYVALAGVLGLVGAYWIGTGDLFG
ncbi:MAG TPA: L-lactate permease, partial [Longimicrobiales bacterium]|nr:L-lactate permease [Longimicrobiales bacterium]